MHAAVTDSVHSLCDDYVTRHADLDPVAATVRGIPGQESRLTDYSPEGHRARHELNTSTLRAVAAARPRDAAEATARTVFAERVGMEVEIHDAGLDSAALNVIESPVQLLRSVFDLMPTRTPADWAVIASRLARVPEAVTGIQEGLRYAAARGTVAALRQVTGCAAQCESWAAGYFTALTADADVPAALRADLDAGVRAASAAYSGLARFLRTELAPSAPVKDAVGADTYALWLRYFTGAVLDPVEVHAWGWQEFLAIKAELRRVADRIAPGAGPRGAAAVLNTDPAWLAEGTEGFRRWAQDLSDATSAELRGSHFDIPAPLATLECRIAPAGGGTYYTGPSDDLSRPGRVWWSLPAGRSHHPTWRKVTTVYHEGVPGHHLQVGTAVLRAGRLNRFQRLLCHVSAHSEGWALYAERLMRELGHLKDDAALMGMLDAQLFRAARVVIDTGMHLELPVPAGVGFREGERWTPELGRAFLLTRTLIDPGGVDEEIDRYLGWPGQAPSYKLGERVWRAARDEARRRHGPAFDAKVFHSRALGLGAMGLDTLRESLAAL
ncbi:DUF885 domain-containing protein [Streptomyces tauricus]|uniref:DUF885 domain-containing protein n=1 Tax=Streptomyces tauricus TaxID=68274 RepID=UPI00167BD626|nr:DUF885 domain-containing protein [Streptomyces tauricus]